jgi:hypothetical protein
MRAAQFTNSCGQVPRLSGCSEPADSMPGTTARSTVCTRASATRSTCGIMLGARHLDGGRDVRDRRVACAPAREPATVALFQPHALRRELRARLADWQQLAEGEVNEARGVLSTVLRIASRFRRWTSTAASATNSRFRLASTA